MLERRTSPPPAGSKKLVLKLRSVNNIVIPAAIQVNLIIKNAVIKTPKQIMELYALPYLVRAY
jgi:hypothetical protein